MCMFDYGVFGVWNWSNSSCAGICSQGSNRWGTLWVLTPCLVLLPMASALSFMSAFYVV